MSLWSRLQGRGKTPYDPWTGTFFDEAERRLQDLRQRPPLPGYEGIGEIDIIERRDAGAHVLLTGRGPNAELFQLKTIAEGASLRHRARLVDEVTMLVGTSATYHLAPLDVFLPTWNRRACAVLYTYCFSDLEARSAAGGLTPPEVIHYAMLLIAEIADLHAHAIRHTAIEPASVFLERSRDTPVSRWRLLIGNYDLRAKRRFPSDYPLPKQLDVREEHLRDDSPAVHHTPPSRAYAPPELVELTYFSDATDIWGFGATVHFLCTGRPPPRVKRNGWLDDELERTYSARGELRGVGSAADRLDIPWPYPRWLAEVLTACLRIEPAHRPASPVGIFDEFLRHVRVESDPHGSQRQRTRVGWSICLGCGARHPRPLPLQRRQQVGRGEGRSVQDDLRSRLHYAIQGSESPVPSRRGNRPASSRRHSRRGPW